MANPIKATTHPRSQSDTEPLNKTWNNHTTSRVLDEQERARTRSTVIYAIFAFAVLVGGYYLYTAEWPSASVAPVITKTDIAPTANAPAAPTTAVTVAPPAATPPAVGNAPAPATTTTP